MDIVQKARALLRQMEEDLQGLMEQGVRNQDYEAVSEIAKLAKGLSDLVGSPEQGKARKPRNSPALKLGKVPSSPARTGKEYPKFTRDGDRLVKIGWSKKKRQEYEHRAPKTAVSCFARKLASKTEAGNSFEMEHLLPLEDATVNRPIPDYQAYITLAWICTTGAVEKKGRDRYLLARDLSTDDALEELWRDLPDYES